MLTFGISYKFGFVLLVLLQLIVVSLIRIQVDYLWDFNLFIVLCVAGSVKMRYPALKFRGQILHIRTSMEVEEAARELLQSLKAKKGVLPGKAAVMQICGNTSLCHVMHTFHSGITSLQFLLEDSTLVKVGVGISGDCAKVLRDYNVSVKSVRTFPIMQIKSLVENLKLGVFALAKILVCKEVVGFAANMLWWIWRKITRILLFCADCVAICVFGWRRMLQLSSFNSLIEKLLVDAMVFLASLCFESPTESDLETGKQMFYQKNNLQYAATDAMVSWKLYQVLKSLPDAKDAPLTIQVRKLNQHNFSVHKLNS
ncbi:hypothetical protein NC652_003288 [Populus alba x Populus x berolinensis]|nr:hypothetical protein NC652_003288 [Populus alba x Populus x berolinensis]